MVLWSPPIIWSSLVALESSARTSKTDRGGQISLSSAQTRTHARENQRRNGPGNLTVQTLPNQTLLARTRILVLKTQDINIYGEKD